MKGIRNNKRSFRFLSLVLAMALMFSGISFPSEASSWDFDSELLVGTGEDVEDVDDIEDAKGGGSSAENLEEEDPEEEEILVGESEEEEPEDDEATASSEEESILEASSAEELPEEIPENLTVRLTGDLELAEGQVISSIAGVLDGQGHVITLADGPLALEVSGTIRNLGVVGSVGEEESASDLEEEDVVSLLMAETLTVTGLIENSYNLADALAGVCEGNIRNSFAGGGTLVRETTEDALIENCCAGEADLDILNCEIPDTGFVWAEGTEESGGCPALVSVEETEESEEETEAVDTETSVRALYSSFDTVDTVQSANAGISSTSAGIAPASADGMTMEIPESCFTSSFSECDTYYYADGITYTYNGETVTFLSESEFEAGGDTYSLKNKKTEITVETGEDGTVTIGFTNLSTPTASLGPSIFDHTIFSGGAVQVVYDTDIEGMGEVRTEQGTGRTAKIELPLTLTDVPEGTWHLTNGRIFDKGSPDYSSGYNFGDGKGKVKERYFCVLPDITFTVGSGGSEEGGEGEDQNPSGTGIDGTAYLGVKTEAKVYDDFENDIWLQYQQKELAVGQKADLYPWRVHQIVTDTVNNDVYRPNFHFEIIAGDSISLDVTESSDKAVVTGVKPGTSVVQVTYDECLYKERTWGAISPVNTAYAVFTVGEEGSAKITASEEFTNWRHYDTIYYTQGETTPYTFTVDAKGAETVLVTVNGLEIQGDGNTYTANLENRSNIIGIQATDADGKVRSMYRVLDARFMEVQIENTSFPGKDLGAGDRATISFRGITMPVYKLATIYNPAFSSQWGDESTYVEYTNAALGTFKGKCGQWDLATRNSFTVTFPAEGDYLFQSERGILCSWWGSDLGKDMNMQGQGNPNTNANTLVDSFSFLPDFTVSVGEENYSGTVDSWNVIQKIEDLPSVETMTLRDKRAVDTARRLYDALDEQERGAVTNYDVLEAAEAKIQELLKAPFIISLNQEILNLVNTGEENGEGGYYYKAAVPEGTETVQLERYTELEVLDSSGSVLYQAGTAAVNLKEIKAGKENSFVLKEQGTDICHSVYFEYAGVGYSVSPGILYPGTEVTVTLKNLPSFDTSKATGLYTKYGTNIPGCENIQSADGKEDTGKLAVLTFTIPEGTEIGTYQMSGGYVELNYVQIIQGIQRPSTTKHLDGQLPVINLTVTDADHVAAAAVIGEIDALGEITSLDQEAAVTAAREHYAALTAAQQKLVLNLDVLEAAEAKIQELKTPEVEEPEKFGYSVSPETIYPGTTVTITLELPELDPVSPIHELYTKYTSDIPGCASVGSADASSDESKLSKISFTVPEGTEPGTYHLTGGFVFRNYGGRFLQGMYVYTTEETLYQDQMPEIDIVVAKSDQAAADEVIAKIDALGEITSLDQAEDVAAVREAYDELTEAQKNLVTNLEKLENAEAEIKKLEIPSEGGAVVVDIERFTIGQGFYKEPVKIAFEAGETVKDILKKLAGDSLVFGNEKENYISAIEGADAGTGICVPEYISEELYGPTTEEAEEWGNTDKALGEFDYSTGSGWYYFVNNEAPNKGVAEYYAKPGDVIRLQFTLVYGSDLTGSDKDAALSLLAEVNSAENKETLLADAAIKAAYDAVAEIVQDTRADQEKVDERAQALKAALEKGPETPVDPEEPVTPEEPVNPPVDTGLRTAYEKTAAYLKGLTPGTGSIGGEWAVLGLARSEFGVTSSYKDAYLTAVRSFIKENINEKGQLDRNKSTENSRIIAALASVDIDPANVEGYNLLTGLSDWNYVKRQGLNGPVWALIALDTKGFADPGSEVSREKLVAYLLDAQLSDGGWARTSAEKTADLDITAMTLYALAPYAENDAKVKAAAEKAVACLSGLQQENGGFAYEGEPSAESCAQVIVALSALGIDADTDARFVKGEGDNAKSAVDGLLSFYVEGGGFRHTNGSGETLDQMATEQAFYAMAAYVRFKNGESRLFDMTDDMSPLDPVAPSGGEGEKGEEDGKDEETNQPEAIESLYNSSYGVAIEGDGLTANMELKIKQLSSSHDDVKLMRRKIPSTKALLRIFDAQLLKDGEEIELPGEVTLHIPVGDKYDGQTLQVLHCHDSKVDSSLKGKVTNGILEVTVDSFSSFGVVVKLSSVSDDSVLDVSNLQSGSGRSKTTATGTGTSRTAAAKQGASISGTSTRTVSNTMTAQIKNGVVEKESFEAIKGLDKNLKMEGQLIVDGKAAEDLPYTLIINGQDVETAKNFRITVREGSRYKEEILKLAEDPYIFCFAQEGAFPGVMEAELTLDVEDGEYLLLRYDEDGQKLTLQQKVEVEDGMTRFLVSEGGTYLLAKRATTKSLPELEEEGLVLTSVDSAGGGFDGTLLTGTGPSVPAALWAVPVLLVLAAAVAGVLVYRRKRQMAEAGEEKEEER